MTRGPSENVRRMSKKLSNNVGLGNQRETALKCGHSTKRPPLATKGDGTALYDCPEGCSGLQRRA